MSVGRWEGIPAAQATIACGDETHHLVWKDGVLTAPQHADPDGERALAALGGKPIACIEMLDTWRRHCEDPRVLLLSSRGHGDLVLPPSDDPHRLMAQRKAKAVARAASSNAIALHATLTWSARGDVDDDEHLTRLLSLGGGLSRRLDATVAAYWGDRLSHPDAETERLSPQLHAALYGRALAALSGWLGQAEPRLTLRLASEAAAPTLTSEADGTITATLPLSWLIDVWARGLEIVWGRFCLAATTTDGHHLRLLTVGPEFHAPTALNLSFADPPPD